jgi:hypothetical protein
VASLQPQHTHSNHPDSTTRAIWQRSSRITGEKQRSENLADKASHSCSFTYRKSTIWDRRLYFPSEGSARYEFLSPRKNPPSAAGPEPAAASPTGPVARTLRDQLWKSNYYVMFYLNAVIKTNLDRNLHQIA